MLSMYLTSVPVIVALEHKGWNNMHATFTKLGNKQIAVHNKLQNIDIICIINHVSSTDPK